MAAVRISSDRLQRSCVTSDRALQDQIRSAGLKELVMLAEVMLGLNKTRKGNEMFRLMLAAVAAVSVVGCAQTLTATPSSISIEYNRNFTDFMDVISEANQHCSQYAKVASLTDTTISPTCFWHTRTFRCE